MDEILSLWPRFSFDSCMILEFVHVLAQRAGIKEKKESNALLKVSTFLEFRFLISTGSQLKILAPLTPIEESWAFLVRLEDDATICFGSNTRKIHVVYLAYLPQEYSHVPLSASLPRIDSQGCQHVPVVQAGELLVLHLGQEVILNSLQSEVLLPSKSSKY